MYGTKKDDLSGQISYHLPAELVSELEPFYKVTCLKEIEENLIQAERLLIKYESRLKEKYHF